jgi:RecB family exonuclease
MTNTNKCPLCGIKITKYGKHWGERPCVPKNIQPQLPLDPVPDPGPLLSTPPSAPLIGQNNIETQTTPIYLSYSQFKMYKECRRRWWLTALRRLKKIQEDKYGPLSLGTKIHKSLEAKYVDGVDPVDWLKNEYLTELDAVDWQDMDEKNEFTKEMAMAVTMMEGFIEWCETEAIDQGMRLVSAEQHVEMPLPGMDAVIHGYLDQVWERESDGTILFRDWKTAADFSAEKYLHNNDQTKIYQLMLKMTKNQSIDGAQYVILKKSKRTARATPPFYKMLEIKHNTESLRSMYLQLVRIVEEMKTIRDGFLAKRYKHQYLVPPNFTKDCSWSCPFYEVCGMFDDGSNIEGLLKEHYISDKEEDNEIYH